MKEVFRFGGTEDVADVGSLLIRLAPLKSWNGFGFVDDHFADPIFLFRAKLGAGLIRVRGRGPRVPSSDGHLLLTYHGARK